MITGKERLAHMNDAFSAFLHLMADYYEEHHNFREYVIDQIVVSRKWLWVLFQSQVSTAGGVPKELADKFFVEMLDEMDKKIIKFIQEHGDPEAKIVVGSFEDINAGVSKK